MFQSFCPEFEPKSKHHHPACVCQPENWTRSINVKEANPPIVNEQCIVYNFQCDLRDASYIGYTRGHLHNRVKGPKQQSSAIAKHYQNVHGTIPQDLLKCLDVLKKCRNKFDCFVYETPFISQISMYNQTLFMQKYFHNLRTLCHIALNAVIV